MRFLSKWSFVLLLTLSLVACKQEKMSLDQAIQHIPSDVTSVTSIDLPGLMKKADFENVKKMEFYQEIIKEASEENATLGEIVANPAQSGIDLDQNLYMVNYVNPENPEEIFSGAMASIKDVAAFEKLLGTNGKLEIKEMEGYKVASSNPSQVIAWNNDIAVVGGLSSYYMDANSVLAKVFGTTSENSIANNADLKKCFSSKHDVKSWLSSNAIAENPNLKMVLPMAGFDGDALKDNYIHSFVDFNDGAIKGHSDLMLQEKLTNDFNLLFKDKVSTNLAKYTSSENLTSSMTVALDLEGLQQALQKRPQGMPMINYTLKEYGLTLQDITNTFGGDILLTSNTVDGKMVGTFVTNIIDDSKLQNFLDLGVQFRFLNKIDDKRYSIPNSGMMNMDKNGPSPDAELIIKDKIISVSGNAAFLEKINNGGFKGGAGSAVTKDLGKNIFGFFMNFQGFKDMIGNDDVELNFQDMKITTERKESDFIMNFKDKSSNSLKQLFESINEIYLKEKAKEGNSF